MDVATWLKDLGLERYVSAFCDNDVDAEVLPKLTADDLIGLGVTSIGHRRKLLAAIAAFGAEGPATTATAAPHDAPAPADAERRQLTVMFCDLAGSTALSSRLDPEDLREVLGSYHAAVAEVVTRFDGYVAKYMGDGVLIYFGYPQAHEDDAERAVRAGLALVERIRKLESGSGALASRIGIATGLVVVGDLIGAGDAQERGVVGETPNLAARLQEMAPANGVIIAEATRRLLGNLFEYRDLGTTEVKGLQAPVTVRQVLRPGLVESRFEALRSASLTPLVGRDAEIELLVRRWERAKEGEGQIVLISGEPGIGKSRLTAALQERLTGEPHTSLRYFCSPHHRDSVLHPFVAQIEHAAGFASDEGPTARLEKLAALLCRSGDNATGSVAVFADLLRLPTETPQPTDPRLKRELIFAALVRQLEVLARRKPVLLVCEDAHWIDQTSLELLERIAQWALKLPVLMAITFRPEFEPPWTGQMQVTALTLSRLGQRDTTTLVERLARGKTLPAEITNRIVERTDGIPLFIEELTKTLLEGGLLREEDGRYTLAASLPPLAIPSSLQDSLMARLDRLTPVKEVAQIGATIGREFSYELLAAVTRRTHDQLCDALDQLVGAGLILRRGVPPQATYVFKHALVQDTAYGTLLRGRRQELHARIAEALEQRLADTRAEHAASLAYHWLRAEDWEKALTYTVDAAERARELNACPEAVTHYWQVLDLLERLSPTSERGRVRIDVIQKLFSLPGFRRNEPGEPTLLRHIDLALTDAADGPVGTIVRLESIKGFNWEDEALLVGAIARAQGSGDALAEALATLQYGTHLAQHDQLEKALGHIALGIDMLGAAGERLRQAFQMASQGRCYFARAGRLGESLAYAARAREAGDILDNDRLRAWRAMETEPYLYKGAWDEVTRVAEEALPAAWQTGEWDVVLWSSAWAATAYLKLGQTAGARRILDRALNEVPARGQRAWTIAVAQIASAQIHLIIGDFSQALSASRRALDLAEQDRQRLEIGAAHRILGQVHEAIGNRTEADAAFRRSLEVLEDIQSRPELAQTLLAYGRFRKGDNQLEDRAMIDRALGLFEGMNATGWIEEARAALAAA